MEIASRILAESLPANSNPVAGAMNRKPLLMALMALMAIPGLVVGSARQYPIWMLVRALIRVVVGGFWSISAAVAMRLKPRELTGNSVGKLEARVQLVEQAGISMPTSQRACSASATSSWMIVTARSEQCQCIG